MHKRHDQLRLRSRALEGVARAAQQLQVLCLPLNRTFHA